MSKKRDSKGSAVSLDECTIGDRGRERLELLFIGEADEVDLSKHLDECVYCRERVAVFRRLREYLRGGQNRRK